MQDNRECCPFLKISPLIEYVKKGILSQVGSYCCATLDMCLKRITTVCVSVYIALLKGTVVILTRLKQATSPCCLLRGFLLQNKFPFALVRRISNGVVSWAFHIFFIKCSLLSADWLSGFSLITSCLRVQKQSNQTESHCCHVFSMLL